ncbi:MAG: NAD-dependent epimerase/dehydratase family protein [Bacteroidales bacterium]|nr:NAD-dependent epimerase/dehydratase family protein [Bacteroidales bacterium]
MKSDKTHKKVLVTGANSLLGTNTILALLRYGYKVKGMLRNRSSFKAPIHPDLELYEGSFTNPADIESAIESCNYVIHTAAITDQDLLKFSDYENVNIKAVRLIAEVCRKSDIEKMIFVGSANACGHGIANEPGTELTPPQWPFTGSYYAQSKIKAQEILMDAAQQTSKTEFVVINPGFMLGPWDSKPSSGRIITMYLNQKIIFCPPGGKSFVHVKDVAMALVQALEKAKNGQVYLLTGENLSYKAFFEKLNTLTGRNKPVLITPKWLLLSAGKFGDFLRFIGIRTSLSGVNTRILCEHVWYSNQKAAKELGVKFTPINKTLQDTLLWFEKQKL